MNPTLEIILARMKIHEGGLSMRRADPGNWTGGKVGVGILKGTKYGIAANTYPHLDIKNLTWDDAKAIYRRDFWMQSHAHELPSPLKHLQFDCAVNSGPNRAIRLLQSASGLKGREVDGRFGNQTRTAVQCIDPDLLVMRALSARLHFMTGLSNWPDAGKGWSRRVADMLVIASGDRG